MYFHFNQFCELMFESLILVLNSDDLLACHSLGLGFESSQSLIPNPATTRQGYIREQIQLRAALNHCVNNDCSDLD